ncbi:MAG: hypothetical protein J6R85_04345 [Lentisphaeria bacterium]|nr:hypothetical protein [Lentisphaeria bacterium]
MRKYYRSIRFLIEYLLLIVPYILIRIMPYCGIRLLAWISAEAINAVPAFHRLMRANVAAAMPELSQAEVKRIARASCHHGTRNMTEFFWASGNEKRIRRVYDMAPEVQENLRKLAESGTRIIFVNPHLGSWEASGVAAPFFAGIDMAAIAKPVRNPYVNRLLNTKGRGRQKGLKIIFSRGAVRAAVKALRSGTSLGTLIDQNTKVRDGGVFVRFFGIPVASSKAPATLKNYCDQHDIPVEILFGVSLRMEDGKVYSITEPLPKPFREYPDEETVIQELMDMSERYIRQYPEQYLWYYQRFNIIPPDCPEDVKKRYPYYAKMANARFFSRAKRKNA